MPRELGTGVQSFSQLIEDKCFFIDKTNFIKDWWKSKEAVSLITRPRRFGKTLNMSMLECFFSPEYAGRADLFEGLDVWNDAEMRELQGNWPVIFVTMAAIKGVDHKDFLEQMNAEMQSVYSRYEEFINISDKISDAKKEKFNLFNRTMIKTMVAEQDDPEKKSIQLYLQRV